jgi:hypothetical protein
VQINHHLPDALSRIEVIDGEEGSLLDFHDTKDKRYLELKKKLIDQPELYKNFNLTNNKIYKQVLSLDGESSWKLLVPKDKIKHVMEKYHFEPTLGHLGVKKAFFAISQYYYWHCTSRDIRKFVQKCHQCQKFRAVQSASVGLMNPVSLLPPWKIVAMDIIGPLVMTPRRNRFILVFVDLCTRWPVSVSIKSATAK